jgi:uncharacterized protein (DUF1697 family)
MSKYVALLRGINLGKRQIKMAELKALFESEGYQGVSTLLASGNVVFSAAETKSEKLRSKIEKAIKEKFGFEVPVILRSEKEIHALIESDPFKGVRVGSQTRFFITFLGEPPKSGSITMKTKEGDEVIRSMSNQDVVSVLVNMRTPDAMDTLKKEFGKNITTRNWNTVLKIHKALEA